MPSFSFSFPPRIFVPFLDLPPLSIFSYIHKLLHRPVLFSSMTVAYFCHVCILHSYGSQIRTNQVGGSEILWGMGHAGDACMSSYSVPALLLRYPCLPCINKNKPNPSSMQILVSRGGSEIFLMDIHNLFSSIRSKARVEAVCFTPAARRCRHPQRRCGWGAGQGAKPWTGHGVPDFDVVGGSEGSRWVLPPA